MTLFRLGRLSRPGFIPHPRGSMLRRQAAIVSLLTLLTGLSYAQTPPPGFSISLTVSGGPLTFNYQLGSQFPATQSLLAQVNIGTASFTATPTVGWLQVNPASGVLGTTSTSVNVSINPTGLSAGAYSGTITIVAAGVLNSPQTVSVTLNVSAAAANSSLSVSTTSLTFAYQIGAAVPNGQTFGAYLSSGTSSFTVSSNATNWLQVSPQTGTLGTSLTTFTVSVTPANLLPGNYNGIVTITASGISGSPKAINVVLTVSGAASGPLSISGNVATANGSPLSGVNISFSNAGLTVVTDGSGNYSASVATGYTGSAAPVLNAYTFNPPTIPYTNLQTSQRSQNFIATSTTLVISGFVSTSTGTNLSGVTITATGGLSTVTDTTGSYSLAVQTGFTGTLTPSLTGYVFAPVSLPYTNLQASQFSQNFVATVTSLPSGAATSYTISTVAGSGPNNSSAGGYGGDGGVATSALLNQPTGVAVDSAGNLYFCDFNARIRKVNLYSGIVTTIAGTGVRGYGGDGGPAITALLGGPGELAVDSAGNVFFSDVDNYRVRKIVAATGIITTVAGNGSTLDSGDGGLAINAGIGFGDGVAVDPAGNLYFTNGGDRVRKVFASTGIIATIAGGPGTTAGDGGLATSTQLSQPSSVALDSSGNIYIAERGVNRIRKISATTGIITTVAGSGPINQYFVPGAYGGDGGPATSALLNDPETVALDSAGNLYISDTLNFRIRKVDSVSGIITTIAGTGVAGFSGDGNLATSEQITYPSGLTLDATGKIYFGDEENNRIRLLSPTITGPTSGVFSHIVDGGGWQTSVVLVNLDSVPASFTLRIYGDGGGAWSPTWVGTGEAATLSGVIPVGGSQTLVTSDSAPALLQGWAHLQSPQLVGGTAIFRWNGQEAAVPLLTSGSNRLLFPFDNSSGLSTGIALAVPTTSTTQELGLVSMRNEQGQALSPAPPSLSLSSNGHTSFNLPVLSTLPQNVRGIAEVDSTNDLFYGLGIRGRAIGSNTFAFTSIEAISTQAPATQTISHLADGATWNTSIILVNSDTVPASFTVNFWKDDGTPFAMPLAGGSPQTTVTGTIPVGGSTTIQSAGNASAVVTGWGEVLSSQSIGGTAIFRWQTNGQEAAVPLLSSSGQDLVFPLENGPNISLGVALVNRSSTQDAIISATIRDQSGNVLSTGAPFTLPRHEHTSFVVAVPGGTSAVLNGTVEFDSAGVDIFGLGIRFNAGAFTSVRAQVRPNSNPTIVSNAP